MKEFFQENWRIVAMVVGVFIILFGAIAVMMSVKSFTEHKQQKIQLLNQHGVR